MNNWRKKYDDKFDFIIEKVKKDVELNHEHFQKVLESDRNSSNLATIEIDKKLSDYIVESFVRFNGIEGKLEEVINFVNDKRTNDINNGKPKNTTSAAQKNTYSTLLSLLFSAQP